MSMKIRIAEKSTGRVPHWGMRVRPCSKSNIRILLLPETEPKTELSTIVDKSLSIDKDSQPMESINRVIHSPQPVESLDRSKDSAPKVNSNTTFRPDLVGAAEKSAKRVKQLRGIAQ